MYAALVWNLSYSLVIVPERDVCTVDLLVWNLLRLTQMSFFKSMHCAATCTESGYCLYSNMVDAVRPAFTLFHLMYTSGLMVGLRLLAKN